MSLTTTIATAIYIYQYTKVVLNGNYFFLFTLFAFDALQFIFVVNVLQSVLFCIGTFSAKNGDLYYVFWDEFTLEVPTGITA